MNTGADDDSLSTPTFAFSASSACASEAAASASIVSKLAITSRALRARWANIIKFPPSFLISSSTLIEALP
jgi:hypothetical protein